MINMMKAEMLRVYKNRSFWIYLIIFIAVYSLCIFVQAQMQESSSFQTTQETTQVGLYISVDQFLYSLNSFVTSIGATFGFLIMSIYFSSMIGQEYSSGYIKNIAILPNGRSSIFIAKIWIALLLSLNLLFVSYLVSFILGPLMIANFQFDPVYDILQRAALLFFLLFASFLLIAFLTTLFCRKSAGIIATFLIASGTLLPLFDGICQMLHLPDFSKYTLSYQYATITTTLPNHALSCIVISLAAILFYSFISLILLRRRDF